jgi:hypothetical protein
MNEWLSERADRLAAAADLDRRVFQLSATEIKELLELARVAAHESGDRRNAPLICYLVGIARRGGSLEDLVGELH